MEAYCVGKQETFTYVMLKQKKSNLDKEHFHPVYFDGKDKSGKMVN